MATRTEDAAARKGLGRDFYLFFGGQIISNLGSSFTNFALPLLVYTLTGSALNLGFSSAAAFLPYLLFGLVIGAWVDRLDRRKMMILTDIGRALVFGSIPLLGLLGALPIWWIYVVGFVGSTLNIFFDAGEFAAIPSLVGQDDLVTANGRIQASYSAASIVGPLLAGALLATHLPIELAILVDAASFLISSGSLALVRASFNGPKKQISTSIRRDVVDGLRYVLGHPVLRNISLMMAMVNLVANTTYTQLVFFAKHRLHAADAQISLFYAAGSIGIIALSLAAGPVRKRLVFSKAALGALTLSGLLTVVFAFTTWLPAALLLWALILGLGILFNINTSSLRQAIVPGEMLGRVMTIAGVLAWSAIPIGAIAGGLIINWTGDIVLVYAGVGIITTAIPLIFALTPLGHAERYLPAKDEAGPALVEAAG